MSLYTTIINDLNKYNYDYFQQEDVCRLCWSKHADRLIITKSPENINDIKNELVDKIRYCLNIDVDELNHPNKACQKCFELIEKFYEFKLFCNETHRKLLDVILNESNVVVKDEKIGIKVENDDPTPEEKAEYTNSSIHDHDGVSDPETIIECVKKKGKIKSNYKAVRTPTYCNICRIDFEEKEVFTVHNTICHGIEDGGLYKCFGCDKRFKSKKTRLGHEINYCKGLEDGYQCRLCSRYLPKRRMYETHMRNHRDNKEVELPEDIFKCSKCYKLFDKRSSLKSHMEVHDVMKKNFVCESCGRVFTRQDYLHKHKLTHSGVKQHVCPHCDFRTTQRSSLTVHIRKHTGERPYSCDVCPLRCVSSSNLRAHRRRHLGLKKYECTICCKKFGYKISLEEHVAAAHERPQTHPCPHCGAAYTRPRGLRRHLLAKHPGNKPVQTQKTQPEPHPVSEAPISDKVETNPGYTMNTQNPVFIV